MINFNEMDVTAEIKTALVDMGFETPTPIQAAVIPHILGGRDVIAQAPTGTGKTCGFGIPAVNMVDLYNGDVQILVLCPTRELAIQTEREIRDVAKHTRGLKVVCIYGGQNIERQLAAMRKRPQIIVGTTGRVMDHMRRKTLKLNGLKMLVLDEVDEMLNMGFREDIDQILKSVPETRQTVMFSATMPRAILEISKKYQTDPINVKCEHAAGGIPNINQFFVRTTESTKGPALLSILAERNYYSALVFCNTKKRVDELTRYLNKNNFTADALHGDMRQGQRDATMRRFRKGDTQILVATDVAARGIDVDNLEAVFNIDVPHDEEYYLHRIGRTARANKTGSSYTFVTDPQMFIIRNLENFTRGKITRAEFTMNPDAPALTMSPPPRASMRDKGAPKQKPTQNRKKSFHHKRKGKLGKRA
ncbi:MAG: DEAD/DEAH box helicase [Firmicutes bacterium]|nr:DEAD/DEAH box helicase [Bacillota bacterium]